MKELGFGVVLSELKSQIKKISLELKEIEESFTQIPEMIESTNILRENESLRIANKKKTELIAAYERYTKQIENLVSSAFEIQNDLKDIVKAQAELMSTKNPRRKKPKSRSKRKTR